MREALLIRYGKKGSAALLTDSNCDRKILNYGALEKDVNNSLSSGSYLRLYTAEPGPTSTSSLVLGERSPQHIDIESLEADHSPSSVTENSPVSIKNDYKQRLRSAVEVIYEKLKRIKNKPDDVQISSRSTSSLSLASQSTDIDDRSSGLPSPSQYRATAYTGHSSFEFIDEARRNFYAITTLVLAFAALLTVYLFYASTFLRVTVFIFLVISLLLSCYLNIDFA
jgi:hypothetical protein